MLLDKNDLSKYVNKEAAIARVFGNEALYARMLKLFLASGEFPSLDEALASGDYSRAGAVAHAIKGLTGNLSLGALFDLSSRLTGELRLGGAPDPELVADYHDALNETTRIVREMLGEQSEDS